MSLIRRTGIFPVSSLLKHHMCVGAIERKKILRAQTGDVQGVCVSISSFWSNARQYVHRGLSYPHFLCKRWDRCSSAFY